MRTKTQLNNNNNNSNDIKKIIIIYIIFLLLTFPIGTKPNFHEFYFYIHI